MKFAKQELMSLCCKKTVFFLSILILNITALAQDDLGSDELFTLARKEAFDNNNYRKAVQLSKKALEISPDYQEIRIFLGRLYTWSDKIDSARSTFKTVLAKEPSNENALSAYFDLEYWNENYIEALKIAERGLRSYPNSEVFVSLKTKAEKALQDPTETVAASPSGNEETGLDSDELFALARKEAFDKNSYPQAVQLAKQALDKSPDYHEIRIFLGRLYTWSDKPDSARAAFETVLAKEPHNEEALNAAFDLEYWGKNYRRALEISDFGLRSYPESESFAVKKAKALNSLKNPDEAVKTAKNFIINNPNSYELAALAESIRIENLKNRISAGYNLFYFDKRFDQPWNYANISYGFETKKIGSYTLSLNYANRFSSNGAELEMDTYPNIIDGLYAYIGAAASTSSIFPKYRIGFSLYKSLPFSMEAEGGLRHLQFSSATNVFVAGLGKYIGNYFIGLRSFLTPSEDALSKSFNFSFRYMLSDDRNDFVNLTVGTGISPDDRARQILIYRSLKSVKVMGDYSRHISKTMLLSISGGWVNEEYASETFGNQFSAGLGLQKRF